MCQVCHARLSPAQLMELRSIRKKGQPGRIGALVCTLAAFIFFLMNLSISNYLLHFMSSFIGIGLLLVGNCINLGVSSSLKPRFRAFAIRVAGTELAPDPEMVEARNNATRLIGPTPALTYSQWHDLAVKYESRGKLGEALYCWDHAGLLGDPSGKLRGIQLRAKHVKANPPADLPPE